MLCRAERLHIYVLIICITLTSFITFPSCPDCHLFWFLCVILLGPGVLSDCSYLIRL
jgi:hypothetical protein